MKNQILFALLLGVTPALAEEHEHQTQEAHVHGLSELKIAVEGEQIAMELKAPGMDIVGFEYDPSSDEDQKAVEQAIIDLGNPNNLFTFNADADCYVSEIFAHQHGAHHDGHEENEEEGEHSAFHAKYEYICHNVEALNSVELPYFDRFDHAQKVEIEIVSDMGAKRIEVSSDEPVAQLNDK